MHSVRQRLGDDYIKHHVIELPGWFSIVSAQKEHIQNQFIISELDSSLNYSQAKESLRNLELLYHTRVDDQAFTDFFKTINLLIANPLSQAVFNLKIKSLYDFFKELPLILFNEQTCRELATLSPFFPSAHDIDKIMAKHIKKIRKNIELLRKIIQ